MPPTDRSRWSRRSFLATVAGGAGGVIVGGPGASAARAAGARPAGRLRTYVIVVDGCRPDEIRPLFMPRLSALRDSGTTYPGAQSLPVMETIPNHVMMMTGVRPDRSGVPANAVYDRAERTVRDLDRPADLRAVTLFDLLRATGRTSGSVLSKRYLHGIFDTRADVHWKPEPMLPVTEHAPDGFTADAVISMIDSADPDLMFVNFGDVDRVGHSDLTGGTLELARRAALVSTDYQIGRVVRHLKDTGRWEDSVLLVLADHSMDWSLPFAMVSLAPLLAEDPLLKDRCVIAQNGGADLLYWTGPDADRGRAVARMREIVLAEEGVLSVHAPEELRLGPEAGDLVAYVRPGHRFSDPLPISNPIPGNHGHPATLPIPFFVSGGSPLVRRGAVSDAPARTVDVAPTVAALYGLGRPPGGWDGTARRDAFVR
ncbi:alkaline phosphatase family protein [Streptomyces sp. S07_1.15]|uniref:alkaline phosphatase family protein n=1 Tax=Streptomyces sp. S07_1.15 TaxID=2873925 RepID=UPI001D136ACE|nr:alkaline phosphatase family protein [Streptomyces sp. S07_1.15]MCC3652405.1 alkaline phosphatase family protein [Streptomyces sp. S07_1.15]